MGRGVRWQEGGLVARAGGVTGGGGSMGGEVIRKKGEGRARAIPDVAACC
jgi:hypothetical protein